MGHSTSSVVEGKGEGETLCDLLINSPKLARSATGYSLGH